ncbi:MAG: tyrosine-protein phosphatase [Actinomycetes bacterium]
MHAHRWVDLEGPSNFRDLGGLPTADGGRVRTGRLFRSDSLALLTERDVERLTDGIGLRRVVDLRSAPEIGRHGQADLGVVGIEIVHAPIVDETRGEQRDIEDPARLTLDRIYLSMLERFRGRFGAAVATLVDPEHQPAVFHCAAGKDRTGLIGALILETCGVDRELVIDDFLLTNGRMDTMIERHRTHAETRAKDPEIEVQTLFPTAENIALTMQGIDETWGNSAEYLVGAGIGADGVARLRDGLVDRSSGAA